jgi:hypothetical protein
MAGDINFIEIATDEACSYCGRRKLSDNDKFYRVLINDNPSQIIVCELCKGGFSIRIFESAEKSYAAHVAFYVRRSFLELRSSLAEKTFCELISCVDYYEAGDYVACFRAIGLIAEKLTDKIFSEKFGELGTNEKLSWENKLGKLLDTGKKTKNNPYEASIYQLFSLKWFRNTVNHPSEYKITADDARLGLVSIAFLLDWELRKIGKQR